MNIVTLALPDPLLSTTPPATSASTSRSASSLHLVPSPPSAVKLSLPRSTLPRLDDLCLKTLAEHHDVHPLLDYLPASHADSLVSLLSDTPNDVVVALHFIQSELYWDKAFQARFNHIKSPLDLAPCHRSYKRAYCELLVQERLEQWTAVPAVRTQADGKEGESEATQVLRKEVQAAAAFVHSLQLNCLPSHIPLHPYLSLLYRLSSFSACFGYKNLKLDHDEALLGMREIDAISLSTYLCNSNSLTHLKLSENRIDDTLVSLLMLGLKKGGNSLTSLDLSRNKIACQGAQELAYLLTPTSLCSLIHLDLQDNHIGAQGACFLADALSNPFYVESLQSGGTNVDIKPSLLTLDLSLNPLTHTGANYILNAIPLGGRVGKLSLVGVGMNELSNDALYSCLEIRNTATNNLHSLNLACNELGLNGTAQSLLQNLVDLVQKNAAILTFDVAKCGFNNVPTCQTLLKELRQLLVTRQHAEDQIKLLEFEKQWKGAM